MNALPMTIFHFLPDLHVGGVLRLMQYTLTEFKGRNIRNVLIYFNSNVEGAYLFKNLDVALIHVPYLGLTSIPGLVFTLYKLAKQYNPNLLHSHLPLDSRFSLLLSVLTKIPLIITLHFTYEKGVRETFQEKVNRWVFALALKRAKGIVSVSENVKRNFPDYLHQKINVIHSGIIDHSAASIGSHFKMGGSPRLLCVGRSHPVKGHEYLVDLVRILRVEFPEVRLYLFTKMMTHSEYSKGIIERIKREELSENFIIVEDIKDPQLILSLYQNADVFVLPSRNESLGLSILEALSFGLPVIASAVGGIPEIIKDSYNGFLFSSGDIIRAAAAIADLARNPEKQSLMSIHARQSYLNDFTVSVSANKLFDFYKSVTQAQ